MTKQKLLKLNYSMYSITIHDWQAEHFQGIPLICYALIYQHSQDGKSKYEGGLKPLKKFTGSSTQTINKHLQTLTNGNWIHETRFDRAESIYMANLDMITSPKINQKKTKTVYINKGKEEFSNIDPQTYKPNNKIHFRLAYKFWKMWKEQEQKPSLTITKAKVEDWENEIRLILANGVSVERLIAVWCYFNNAGKPGFDTFWVSTIKSVAGLRKHKDGVYYIDRIASVVNNKLQEDKAFNREVALEIQRYGNN